MSVSPLTGIPASIKVAAEKKFKKNLRLTKRRLFKRLE